MKLAIVHDDLVQRGGAERVVEAMSEVWPEAPIYTALYDPKKIKVFKNRRVYSSFIQRIPFSNLFYRMTFPLHSLAFESFSFDDYDVVLSSSSRFAHGVITKPSTLHICYCYTPARMFWNSDDYFRYERFGLVLRSILSPVISYMRVWDFISSNRPDHYLTSCHNVARRIDKLYRRKAQVIYPFVDESRFLVDSGKVEGEYYLITSRLLSYKRIDIAVEACSKLSLPLYIIGDGPDRGRLEKLAGPTVKFLGRLTDEEAVRYYRGCKAFLFPGEEDFGITPLEAMMCGRPVIAYRGGGSVETVANGITGTFFTPQTTDALVEVLANFSPASFEPESIMAYALKFSKERFKEEIRLFVEKAYHDFKTSREIRKATL